MTTKGIRINLWVTMTVLPFQLGMLAINSWRTYHHPDRYGWLFLSAFTTLLWLWNLTIGEYLLRKSHELDRQRSSTANLS